MTRQDAVNWLLSKEPQGLDFDGIFGNQCVDYFNYYYQFVTGRNPYSDGYGVDGAKDLWNVGTDLFTKVANDPNDANQVPNPGDVLIYNRTWGGGWGHVEMVISADTRNIVVSAQNTKGQFVAQHTRSWNSVVGGLIGWMSFNGFKEGEKPMTVEEEKNAYRIVLGREMEHNGSGRTGYQFITAAKAEIDAQRNAQAKMVADLQTAIRNEQSKPPREVKVEVEKIVKEYVDRPVEVIKEVNPSWLEASIQFIRKVLKIN